MNEPITKIVVHCSDSPHGRGDDAREIHRWHKQKGWWGVGYHYVILEDGTVEKGRPDFWVGSHVKGHNQGSLGICLIGISDFTGEQLHSLQHLVDTLLQSHPKAKVFGHYQLDPDRKCPHFNPSDVLELRDESKPEQ